MGKIICESGREFGEFAEENLFWIEHSDMFNDFGEGVKTVEFITRLDDRVIMFLEAKTGCPNPANKLKDKDSENKFTKFYDDIAEKFQDSLQIFTAGILERYEKNDDQGTRNPADRLPAGGLSGACGGIGCVWREKRRDRDDAEAPEGAGLFCRRMHGLLWRIHENGD